jgi:hypothetical protein
MLTTVHLLAILAPQREPDIGFIHMKTTIVSFKCYVSKTGVEFRVETAGDKLHTRKKWAREKDYYFTVPTMIRVTPNVKDTSVSIDPDLRKFTITSGTLAADPAIQDWTPFLKDCRITSTWSSLLHVAIDARPADRFLDSLPNWTGSEENETKIFYNLAGNLYQFAGILSKDSDDFMLTKDEAKKGQVILGLGNMKSERT